MFRSGQQQFDEAFWKAHIAHGQRFLKQGGNLFGAEAGNAAADRSDQEMLFWMCFGIFNDLDMQVW